MSRLTINSNLPSLNAQRNLGNASKSLETSFTRLSSGLRINKASDDAAGLSISESLKADTRIFNQGIRNLNDGLSLLSIADGALNELTNIVTRLSELAEQSANGTLGNKQRLSLDQEAQSLSKEYNRIARSTEFNGRKIFNGDFGDLSLAAGGNASSLITDGLGGAIGDGSFKQATSYRAAVSPMGIKFADFNNDGIDDLINGDWGGAAFTLLTGNADGSFRSSVAIGDLPFTASMSVGDIDNDGNQDVVIGGFLGDVKVYRGNGNGTFSLQNTYMLSSQVRDISLSDMNNDGTLDIVATNFSNTIHIFTANQNFTFNAQKVYSATPGGGLSSSEIIDINSDGNLDIVSSSYFSGTLEIFLGNGDGSLKAVNTYTSTSPRISIELGDFNNDGITDIISGIDVASDTLEIRLGNGDGTFKNGTMFGSGLGQGTLNKGDFNGDGNLDISYVLDSNNSLGILFGSGNGTFQERVTFQVSADPRALVSRDLNNDNILDLVYSDFNDNSVKILIGNSNQGVSALQSFSLKTQQDSRDSITYLRKTLNLLSNQRGEIGAFQSRVETGVSNLQQSSLAYSEANSRITDIDVAEESSTLTRTQILQRSATSILAQANLQPRLVLSLLEDI